MFEKVIEDRHLRFRWTGSSAIDATWRFIEFTSRHGTLYVRVHPSPRAYYKANGTVAEQELATLVLGRAKTAERLIKEKMEATATLRREPSSGNPYGRFPEGVEMGLLGRYDDMQEVDFLGLADGLGLRVLDQGYIEVFGGYPAELTDEWGHRWTRVSEPTEYRPWALYTKGDLAVAPPDSARVLATASSCGLPTVRQIAVHITLDREKYEVIRTWDRKAADDQKKVMKGNSANEVARLLGLRTDVGYEWLHMIAFTLGGHMGNPQIPENLVLGTEAANTAMMSIEGFAKSAIARGTYPSATIAVTRTAPVPGCAWFATDIHYTIRFNRPILSPIYVRESFNPLTLIAPTFDVEQMTRQLRSRQLKSAPAPVPVSDTMRKPGPPRPRRL